MRGPIWYPGGKGHQVKYLVQHISNHNLYVEVFGGGASLLFHKEPSAMEVYNDADNGLVNLFRVLKEPELFHSFVRKAYLTLHSRSEFYYARDNWNNVELPDVDRACLFYIALRQGYVGETPNGKTGWSRQLHTVASTSRSWLSALKLLPEVHARLLGVQIECLDYSKLMHDYDSDSTFFYVDPPYLGVHNLYHGFAFTEQDHIDLLTLLCELKGKVLLSGYYNDLYSVLDEVGWRRCDYAVKSHIRDVSVKLAADRVESVWMNY